MGNLRWAKAITENVFSVRCGVTRASGSSPVMTKAVYHSSISPAVAFVQSRPLKSLRRMAKVSHAHLAQLCARVRSLGLEVHPHVPLSHEKIEPVECPAQLQPTRMSGIDGETI